ncbi:MAG TPA: hypothetical protein VN181_07980 [Thermoanaerobaculia bacterium]|nr:hypothetical protein [Thermoanaerobaculia bacterium]
MRRLLVVLTLLVACRGRDATTNATPPQPPRTPAELTGPPENMRNAKVNEVLTFDRSRVIERSELQVQTGKPIVLTMWLKESPGGLETTAEWLDDDGDKLFVEQKPMNGAKVATFTLAKKLRPGHYRVVGYWGGNIAAEHEFQIRR